MPKNEKSVVLTPDTATGISRPLTPEETTKYAEKTRSTVHGMYKDMEASGDLAGFKKANPKGFAAMKKLHDEHVRLTSTTETKPAAKKPAVKKAAPAAKPASKPAAKPAAKKTTPVKKK